MIRDEVDAGNKMTHDKVTVGDELTWKETEDKVVQGKVELGNVDMPVWMYTKD